MNDWNRGKKKSKFRHWPETWPVQDWLTTIIRSGYETHPNNIRIVFPLETALIDTFIICRALRSVMMIP